MSKITDYLLKDDVIVVMDVDGVLAPYEFSELSHSMTDDECEKYSAYDKNNRVHCNECPLSKGNLTQYDFRCKANSHYNRHTREWEYDD